MTPCTFTAEASISSNGKLVIFASLFRGQTVRCSITRDALEQHFWAPAGADETRLLKAYFDGHGRIAAAVERKLLKSPDEPIKLSTEDFSH
ncbi:Protein of unknown function [Burkholderia sp. WP9]|uniref:DUF1488 family protein n=1 Tax=Burkholderia sp. WP9 TaxID=1500263 RepID=UPI00089ABC50|nr:DUF1488 family protein [Burkholderia sp. WP9]SEB96303.1 Protein of unknown function [Burkholderia sp. WP9]